MSEEAHMMLARAVRTAVRLPVGRSATQDRRGLMEEPTLKARPEGGADAEIDGSAGTYDDADQAEEAGEGASTRSPGL